MRGSKFVLVVLLLSRVLLPTEQSTAQSVYGQVSGRLITVSGTPVSEASVIVTSVQTGTRARTKSDNGGGFYVDKLRAALFQREGAAQRFKRLPAARPVKPCPHTHGHTSLPRSESDVARPP